MRQMDPNEVMCARCGRVGTRGFIATSSRPYEPFEADQWACASTKACEKRQAKKALPEVDNG